MKRKIFSVLLTLVLVVSFSLVTAVPAVAQVGVNYYVNAATGDDNRTAEDAKDASTPWSTIQHAVDTVPAESTINVAAGTYTATSLASIVITNDNLSLVGESRDETIIDAGTWGTSGADWPKGIHVYANNVTIKNFTVQGFTGDGVTTGGYGILFRDYQHDMPDEGYIYYSGGVVDNVKLQNNYSAMYALVHRNLTVRNSLIQNNSADGMFIARECDNATITGNTVINSGDHGIWVGSCWMALGPSDNAIITNNIVDGAREGGISFVGSVGATISGNTITNVAGEDPSVGGWSVGALSLKDGCSNVEAYDNTIYNNDGSWGGHNGTGHGIGIDGTPSNINLYFNDIYGNIGDGCHNYSTVVVNATNNWWGSANGPGQDGANGVSANVLYNPWLSGGPGAYAWIDANLNGTFDLGEPRFATIQLAIDAALPGTTITVAAGTYNEAITIDKEGLTLEGAQVGIDPTVEEARTNPAEESTVTGAVRIKASDIVVDGFRIEGTVYVDDSVSAITDATISNNIITGASYGIRVGTASNNVISQLIIEYNAIIDNANKGICFWKVDWAAGNLHDVTIRDNTISGNTDGGISTYGAGPYFVVDNTVTGNQGNGISLKYDDGDIVTGNIVTDNDAMGINMHEVTNCVVEDNTVSGHVNPEVVTTFYGPPLTVGKGSGIYIHELSVGNTICFNDLTGNRNGVLINNEEAGDPPSANSINYNNVTGNTDYGVLNATPSLVDALYNYWGDETGPDATLNPGGKGNAVSGNVLFSPWLYETQEEFIPGEPCYAGSVVLENEATLVDTTSYAGGWNTFSTPILLDSDADSVGELLTLIEGSGLSIVRAQRFDSIEGWVTLVMGTVIDEAYEIKPGEGFFIQVSTKGSLPILCSMELFWPQSRELSPDWNLVGAPSYESKLVENGLFSLGAATVVNSPGANPRSWSYPPAAATKLLLPGRAYWVAMSADETLMCFDGTPVADDLTWHLNQ